MTDDVLVRAEGVSKRFCRDLKRSLWYGVQDTVADLVGRDGSSRNLRPEEFWAVDDVSFELKRGECLGLVGRNGAGKTTLLKMLNGLIKPDRGRIEMRGRVGALIALGAGFNPILTGRENVYINGTVLGLSKREIDAKYDEIVDFAEIGDFINAPVQSYSSGMHVRLGFAVATALQPDVLLLDEVLAVGDANFQAKCYQRIGKSLEQAAVIFVSHQAYHIKRVCDHALFLERGKRVALGSPERVLAQYGASMSAAEAPKKRVINDPLVTHAEVVCAQPEIGYGGILEFTVRLELAEPLRCDQAYLNIVDTAGAVHAQAIMHGTLGEFVCGVQSRTISVGPLFLSKGRFHGNLMLLGAGGKTTITHLRNCFTFENDGPLSMGPTYYPPSRVIERSEDPAGAFTRKGVSSKAVSRDVAAAVIAE